MIRGKSRGKSVFFQFFGAENRFPGTPSRFRMSRGGEILPEGAEKY